MEEAVAKLEAEMKQIALNKTKSKKNESDIKNLYKKNPNLSK